ncbi:MAG: DUF3488 domain-containing protein [Planctomycetaceae bacterium]|nr:DUF3488 domain-containing protein [Planctomycetaceae bacterium]
MKTVNVESVFFVSIAAAVSASAMMLASAEDSTWPAGWTPAVAAFSYFLIERRQKLRLSVTGANILGLICFGVATYEFYGASLLGKLLAGAHLLVYITWVVLLLPKGIRQFWWILALSVLQISVASILTNSPAFGAALVGMLLLMIWTLSAFTLYRARRRVGRSHNGIEDSLASPQETAESAVIIRNGLQIDTDERWVGWRFTGIVGFAFVASLFVGGVAFALFPRIWVPQSELARIRNTSEALIHQTGFTDDVQLGEIGQIMQSDDRVLQFEITRMDTSESVVPDVFAQAMNLDEIMFRGNALGHYADGRWTSGSHQGMGRGDYETTRGFNSRAADSDFRIRIVQDPPISTVAFAPVPFNNAVNRERRGSIEQRRFSYSLVHQLREGRPRSEPMVYEVWCTSRLLPQNRHQPRPNAVGLREFFEIFQPMNGRRASEEQDYAYQWCITRNLQDSLPGLTRLTIELCGSDTTRKTDRDCLRQIEQYLMGGDRFRYSLQGSISDPSIDPVEDFLLNRQTGHCEYFASTCALMLQAAGIPARVVNGYKGCDVNTVTGKFEVRQKHAHTWVEAFIDDNWETIDPTPAAARHDEVQTAGTLDWWRDLRTAMSDVWFDFVEKMSPQRQEAMVRPWIESAKNAVESVQRQGLWATLKQFWNDVIRQPGRWYSGQVWLVTFVLLSGLVAVTRLRPDHWLARPFRYLLSFLDRNHRNQKSVVRFYEQFRQTCRRNGLTLAPSQTAIENAIAARQFFARKLSNGELVLPDRIAGSFNRIRFGGTALTDEALDSLKADVQQFAALVSAKNRSHDG